MQESMPSASTSTFMRPTASMSSLSHSMKVRSAMAALPIGTVSSIGTWLRTKPPTCCDRWRGKPMSAFARSTAWRMAGFAGSSPACRTWSSGSSSPQWPQTVSDSAAVMSGVRPERLADLADRHARAVVDDGRADRGAVAAVASVEVLDDLLAPLMLEIDVDVRRLAAVGRDEAGEKRVALLRVDGGDAEAVADGAVRGGAAALAEDALALREGDDVVHGEEILRVFELLDERELVVQERLDLFRNLRSVAPAARGARSAPRDIAAASCRVGRAPRGIRNSAHRARSCTLARSRPCARSRPDRMRKAAPSPRALLRWRSACFSRRRPASRMVHFSRMQVTTSCNGRRSGA